MLTSACQDRALFFDGLYYFQPSLSTEIRNFWDNGHSGSHRNHKRKEDLKGLHKKIEGRNNEVA
jgi:hypothetical protein